MAITLEHASIGTNADTGGSSLAITTTATVASGALFVLTLGFYTSGGNTLTGVTTTGLTWTIDKQGGPFNPKSAIASAPAPSGLASGATITATWSGSNAANVIGASSLLGADTGGSRVDVTSGPTADEGDAAWTTASMSLLANSAIVAVIYNESAVSGSTTTYTELIDTADGFGNGMTSVLRVGTSAGSYTAGGTWSGTANGVVNGVAYKVGAATDPTGGGFDLRKRLGRDRGRFPLRGNQWY
jgi:hypothetical protein